MNANAMHDARSDDGFGVVASLRELIALRERVIAGRSMRAPAFAAPSGSHASMHRSRGMEFAEARPYRPGDDVRTIDWRQTARRGRVYTKLFQEEHERPVRLLVDMGPSMRFGTRTAFKSVAAARAAAWLAWTAAAAGDRVGGLVWNGGVQYEIHPQGRHQGALALLRRLADVSASPPAQALPLAAPLQILARTLRPGSAVVLISDFAALDAEAERQVAALANRAELVLIHVYDTFEVQAPAPGCYRMTDGGRSMTLDLRAAAARAAYGAAFAARRAALEKLAQRGNIVLVPLATDDALETILPCALFSLPGYSASAQVSHHDFAFP